MDSYKARDWILKVLLQNKRVIRREAFLDIKHYVEHTEYEMAFEYLLLELMESHSLPCLPGSEILSVATQLGLDQDYHYDEHFWSKLKIFCAQADHVNESKH
ncbi:hypothetical protein ABRP29_07650 [Pseudomonas sp. WHRI 8822A]|uniref:hypothetical protein n=1 Tax=Pseudomonas sp. WHRI 8822A TaxID=3162568 RepID=UPI0032EB11AC